MMKIAAHRGNRSHAPENTFFSLVSAYTSGAQVLEFDLQLTRDHKLVVSHDGTINRLCGLDGAPLRVLDNDLKQLRWGEYDFSNGFNPNDIDDFNYYAGNRRLQIEEFSSLLDRLPIDAELLVELKDDSIINDENRNIISDLFINAIEHRNLLNNLVLYSRDHLILRLIRQRFPKLRTCVFNWEISPQDLLELMNAEGAEGMVISLDNFLQDGELTEFGRAFERVYQDRELEVGAVLYPYRRGKPGIFLPAEYEALKDFEFIWSLSTDSTLEAHYDDDLINYESIVNQSFPWLEESFTGNELDRDYFSFGYAKANRYCLVELDNGVKVQLDEYDGYLPRPVHPDPVIHRLNRLEFRMLYAERNWPYYSGGGVGVTQAIKGDFYAIVDYELDKPLTQAQTMEMAVTNVDPGRHQERRPRSFRDADSFYDPHGCPPYFGVEHDENDGYRINWNLGTAYDNNQYGTPVGDGTVTSGTLRLERRGNFFSGYYKNIAEAPTWICVGAIENSSLNDTVYLRCVAKRWLQENSDGGYHPIEDNNIRFRNLRIFKPTNSQSSHEEVQLASKRKQ